MSGCSGGMNLYLTNVSGGPMTLQNVVASYYAPGVMHVVPSSASAQLVAWAYGWDPAGTISYNLNDGVVLNIVYTGGSIDEINATFTPSSQDNWEADKSVIYENCLLITVKPPGGDAR